MGQRYFFKDLTEETFIPINNGEFLSSGMSAEYSTGQCYLQFYDAQKQPVTPTGGTVTFRGGAFDGQKLMPTNGNGIINATDVVAGEALYTPPLFDGCIVFTSMTLSGITGATYVRAYHWRDE